MPRLSILLLFVVVCSTAVKGHASNGRLGSGAAPFLSIGHTKSFTFTISRAAFFSGPGMSY